MSKYSGCPLLRLPLFQFDIYCEKFLLIKSEQHNAQILVVKNGGHEVLLSLSLWQPLSQLNFPIPIPIPGIWVLVSTMYWFDTIYLSIYLYITAKCSQTTAQFHFAKTFYK